MAASAALDWIVYPLAYIPSDLVRYHFENTLLSDFDDTFMDIMAAKGDIRPANANDLAQWNAVMTNNSYAGHLAQYNTENMYVERTYVVLKAISIPGGMYGAHSRDFIVPDGVAVPRDYGSHNSYYFMKDGTITGPAAHSG